jgi:anti-sigma regulatory factor (Ser/Thr protein kinase)
MIDLDANEVTRLDGASAPPVGVAVPIDIVEATLPLPDRAALLMYTDGLVERRGRNIGDAIALLGRVLQSEPVLTPGVILARIADTLGSPDDDVAVLLLSLDLQRLSFEVELPADPAALQGLRRRLRGWLARRGVGSDEAAGVVLAVSEACNNAIEHAYRDNGVGQIKVSLASAEDGMLHILVEDHGTWRDDGPSAGRGRGIGLMEQLMHSTDIQTGRKGTRVTLQRRLGVERAHEPEEARATP